MDVSTIIFSKKASEELFHLLKTYITFPNRLETVKEFGTSVIDYLGSDKFTPDTIVLTCREAS